PAMTVILVFPRSCGGFRGGVTECGLGSPRWSRCVAFRCAHRCVPCGGSVVGAVGDPVNTVVDNESATAARGSPAGGPVLDAPTSGPLDTPDEALDGPGEDLDESDL